MGGRHPTTPAQASAAHEQLNSPSGLDSVWIQWTVGDVVTCAGDGAPVALCVDATIATYKFICVHCGNASQWFEVNVGEVRSRPTTISEGLRGSSRPER